MIKLNRTIPDTLDQHPRPIRVAGSVIGAVTTLVSGLVGSGLLTENQGGAITGLITAAITLLASFGIVATTEKRVTPLADPRDRDGRPLTPDTTEQ